MLEHLGETAAAARVQAAVARAVDRSAGHARSRRRAVDGGVRRASWPMPSRKPPEQGAFDFGPARRAPEPSCARRSRADSARRAARPTRRRRFPSRKRWPRRSRASSACSDLVRGVARTVEASLRDVAVEGEISNLSAPRSGHLYFTLKDAEAQLPAVMFRTRPSGSSSRRTMGWWCARAVSCSIFERKGSFSSMSTRSSRRDWARCSWRSSSSRRSSPAEGLFDAARKRPLPKLAAAHRHRHVGDGRGGARHPAHRRASRARALSDLALPGARRDGAVRDHPRAQAASRSTWTSW